MVDQFAVAMLTDNGHHAACVDAWLLRAARDLSGEQRVQLFEAALGALWSHTRTTLGEVTLGAIAVRVAYGAAERFPLFAALTVDPIGGFQGRRLRAHVGAAHDAELTAGMHFVLVEFLSVLGNLTAEILTPELHAALMEVSLPESASARVAPATLSITPDGAVAESDRS